MTAVLEARGITKRFSGVVANDGVDLDLREGEIHALLGENGAGKSTLMNILYGLLRPDEGELRRGGRPVSLRSPSDAIALGIGMVHQHFMLIPVFTVAENVVLGAELVRGGLLDRRRASAEVRALSARHGLDVDPDARVEDLPVGVQQRVEILKALYRKAEILILDEPTAVLTPQEADELFRVLRGLTARGVSVLFITHKLREVLAVADRVTVMRAGKVVGAAIPAETDERGLAATMVGREVALQVSKAPASPGAVVLEVERLSVAGRRGAGADVVRDVSFSVRAGEILGIAGVQGNGQTELVEAVTGLAPPRAGRVLLRGRDVTGAPPRDLIERGVSHVPEDRQRHGLVLSYAIADNLVLCTYHKPPFAARGVLRDDAREENARRLIKTFDIRAPGPGTPVSALSGGNQQKVILAREMSRPVELLVASQPTRGVDVGSIEHIHREIVAARDAGAAVLLVSAELDEILALSDRIAVMYRGGIVATRDAGAVSRTELGMLMAGALPGEAAPARDGEAAPARDAGEAGEAGA
ncbi:ABC transporter ATP-binding protein [Sorangium cellulosum]|uniref:Macrolide ABC transporter ATP-binding protein n=1 Tax=Sorangium cellulosum So0157-2 TaxID=1254432 RepID=S4XQJ2_SORCE|nr:ABC transporter ATP-binding protein [Sorangium cellulosum]AGP32878.1 macrolide ABC transporter ATP-binding protein [Sorangium cellulosum So0157-2]